MTKGNLKAREEKLKTLLRYIDESLAGKKAAGQKLNWLGWTIAGGLSIGATLLSRRGISPKMIAESTKMLAKIPSLSDEGREYIALIMELLPPEYVFDPTDPEIDRAKLIDVRDWIDHQRHFEFGRYAGQPNAVVRRGPKVIFRYHGRVATSDQHAQAGDYLLRLLLSPGRSISAQQLETFGAESSAAVVDATTGKTRNGEVHIGDEEGSYVDRVAEAGAESSYPAGGGSGGDQEAALTDRKTIRMLEARAKELKDELFSGPGKFRRLQLERELEDIERFLKSEWNWVSGRSRNFPTREKKAVDAVRAAILKRLLPHIHEQHPDLAVHLSRSLTLKQGNCVYAPNPPEEWVLRVD